MRLLPAPLVLLAACGTDFGADEDNDGFPSSVDCDDADADVFPGAVEACDGIDNDCDGIVDDDASDGLTTHFADLDDDGAAGDIMTVDACEAPEGFFAEATDCDDLDERASPELAEACDGIDNDCDGETDEDGDDITWYADADADGFGDENATLTACAAPAGYVRITGDCNDDDVAIHPGANETCASSGDDNCDGLVDNNPVDGTTYFLDVDGDGFGGDVQTVQACALPEGAYTSAEDCDDVNAAVFPGADEACNGIDDDCDDEIDVGALDAPTWYADTDSDSFGDPAMTLQACDQPADYVDNALDCTPGSADSEQPGTRYWVDGDTDGFGAGQPTLFCDDPGTGYAADGTDCDDDNPAIRPDAAEICDDNDVDEDCDGRADDADDDATGGTERFLDLDDDGFGVRSVGLYCDDDVWHAEQDEDCDDDDPERYPGAPLTSEGSVGDCTVCADAVVGVGDLVINELLIGSPDSDGGEFELRPGYEWIEILNATDRELAICTEWEITYDSANGTDAVVIAPNPDVTVAPGGLLVLGQSIDPAVNGQAPVDFAYGTSFDFPDYRPPTLTLSVDGEVVDSVPFTYDIWGAFFGSAISAQLDPGYRDAQENDCMDYWCSTDWEDRFGDPTKYLIGTPGEANPTCRNLNNNGCNIGSGSA